MAVTMWMSGFQWGSRSSDPCIAFLVEAWTISTRFEFLAACIVRA